MRKIIGIILLSVLVVSLSACSVRFEVRGKNKNNIIKDVVNTNNSIPLKDEKKIDIEITGGEIELAGYDGDEVTISVKSNLENDIINLSKSKETIKVDDNINIGIDLSGNNIQREIIINIPYSFNGDIEFKYGAGKVEVEGINCDTIDIDGGAGELKVNDILFNKLYFSAGVGKSDIELLRKCGEIYIDGGVGAVEISLAEVGGNLSYDGGVGSAKIKVPENSPVYFNTSSGLGRTNINAITSSEKTYEFDIDVGIGEVNIYN